MQMGTELAAEVSSYISRRRAKIQTMMARVTSHRPTTLLRLVGDGDSGGNSGGQMNAHEGMVMPTKRR